MANEFNAKGRRMVFEEDIEKIGQGGGSEYTAGNGIDITNNEISVDETEIQGKLTAGSGISIENDVISATGGSSEVETIGYEPDYIPEMSGKLLSELLELNVPVLLSSDSSYTSVLQNGKLYYLHGFGLIIRPNGQYMLIGSTQKVFSNSNNALYYVLLYKSSDTTLHVGDVPANDNTWGFHEFRFTGTSSRPDTVAPISMKNYTVISTANAQWNAYENGIYGISTIVSQPTYSNASSGGRTGFSVVNLNLNSSTSDGTYALTTNIQSGLVKQEYARIGDAALTNSYYDLDNRPTEFPSCPTDTDGTYVLEATVSSGTVVYNWVLKQ